jgi:fatty acid/phospholipid biosynthesis enzyme
MKIVLDAMGGDHAPQLVVDGAVQAAREWGTEIILVGQEEVVLSWPSTTRQACPCPSSTPPRW